MLKSRLLGTAVAVSAVLVGAAALADPQVSERPESAGAVGMTDPNAIALNNAAARVEAQTGGTVMDIRYKDWNGKGAYDAVVARGNTVTTLRMEAATGHILPVAGTRTPDWAMSWKHHADVRSAKQAIVPLSAAIATAEAAGRAPAIEAGLAKPLTADNDVLAYNVELMMNGKPELVAVDATTNQVIANPNALGLPDHEPGFILPGATGVE